MKHKLVSHEDKVKGLIAKHPDMTLEELKEALGEAGIGVSKSAIDRYVKYLGISRKKTLHADEQQRSDIAAAREEWRKGQKDLDVRKRVFLDETWASTNMARVYGRCSKGKRLKFSVPQGHWRTTTFIGALRHDRLVAPCVFDGPIDGNSFLAYVKGFLAPTLAPGDIVVMDNLSSHKVPGVLEAIEE